MPFFTFKVGACILKLDLIRKNEYDFWIQRKKLS